MTLKENISSSYTNCTLKVSVVIKVGNHALSSSVRAITV